MITRIRQMADNQSLRSALDWTVFSLGALSLTVAVTATILTHTGN